MTSLIFLTLDLMVYSTIGISKTIYTLGRYVVCGKQEFKQKQINHKDIKLLRDEIKTLNDRLDTKKNI